ncbi:MAG: hypothetical protein ACKOEO_22055, partial [Planctomycetaceae bacterium]
MHARMNRLDAAINTTISTPAGPVEVKFDSAADVTQFGGSARLAVGGFVDISGSFGIEKSGNELLVGVTDVSVFLGVNAGTPGAIGLQVSDGTLGLVLRNGKYALTASGAVGLVGLDGLGISGTFMVEANKLGTSVNRSIWTPGGSVSVVFANGSEVLKFGGSAVISVAGVFEIRGEVIATKTKSGRVLIDIPEIAVALNIRGLRVFEVGGRARFSIGGPDGFELLDVGVTEVSVFGFDIAAAGGSQPSLALPPEAPVPAQLTTIVDGIDAGVLNRRKFLDVTFESPGDAPLDISSILDTDREISLSGAGVLDAAIDRVEQLEGNTFRYHLKDRDTSNEVDLFGIGGVTVNFLPDSWMDTDGTKNVAASDSFTTRDGAATTSRSVKLGPLSLSGPYFGIEDFQFRPLKSPTGEFLGARITITVGLGVDEASLDFGGSSSSLSTKLTGLLGTFAVNVDLGTDLKPQGGSLGKFTVGIETLELTVSDVLKANAEGIFVGWDPEKDKDGNGQISAAEQAAYDSQEIVRLNSASIEITKLNLAGALRPYQRRDGTTIPGLVVRNNGFQLGEAELSYTGELNFGNILKLKDIRAGVADFGVSFSGAVNFNGEVFIASGGADLFPGKKF